MFLWLIITHENIYSDNAELNGKVTISNYYQVQSLFREEDTAVFRDTLILYYDLFKLFHSSITELFMDKDIQTFRNILHDFTTNFDRNFFHTDWGRTYFNNCVYRGYSICPLDSKVYLYACKYVNGLKTEFTSIKWIWVFFRDYHLYSDLPQESVEILHLYLVGAISYKRDGYQQNWMDDDPMNDGYKIPSMRVPRKPTSKITSQNSSFLEIIPNEESKEMTNGEIHYWPTDFWKPNKLGFVGLNEEKKGFILGPSVFRLSNKNDREEMRTYELYAPTVYIRDDPYSDERKPYKLVVLTFN